MLKLRTMVALAATLAVAAACATAKVQDTGTSASSTQATVDTTAIYEQDDITTPPELSNRDAVARALSQNYPDALRNQGIAGSASVEATIDRIGRVEAVRVVNATIPEFAQASEAVVRVMRFRPGMLRGVPVRTRVRFPVSFAVH